MVDINTLELTDSELDDVVQIIRKFTGMTIAANKRSLIQGRIRPRMRIKNIETFSSYIQNLEKDHQERQEFINQITTNETSFFRTPRLWDYFKGEFLPSWQKSNPGKKLSIWSGASSSGEEIYSISIACLEFSMTHPGFDYMILGTDISTKVLAVAEKGVYTGKPIDGLIKVQPEILKKYFKREGDTYSIDPKVKAKVRFSQHNLLHKMNQKFHLVFLRNVLIYFSKEEQQTILQNVSDTLSEGSNLFLGESESLNGIQSPFQFVVPLVYAKRC